jgi:hypothetical protein
MAVTDERTWVPAPDVPALTGAERLGGLDATIRDFWAFAMSDLRVNNVRGYFAEFLVREAVGATHPRVEWDAADVLTPDGTRIEVKSSAYLQVWAQAGPSKISFKGLKSKLWTPQTGYAAEATYNADVYVFAVQTAYTHEQYDPLDVSQWSFWPIPVEQLRARNAASVGLAWVQAIADPVPFTGLAAAITQAAAQ